jgi:hypothetical protein
MEVFQYNIQYSIMIIQNSINDHTSLVRGAWSCDVVQFGISPLAGAHICYVSIDVMLLVGFSDATTAQAS